ncbi:unnamed protein product [Leptosia nina]|uniref:Odorant receptor n=1 Tax=Leptosia nina TaxID=320188 RepID=A0AAV1J9L1_9NEOP
MLKRLKKFYEKENFDFSSGYVDPFEFHRTCYIFLKAFQVWDAPIPKWTYFLQTLVLFCGLSALSLLSLALYHGADSKDIGFMTEAGTYELIMYYKLIILSCTKLNIEDYHLMLRLAREDFQYVCDKGLRYRSKFFDNQLKTWKICLFSILFIAGIGLGMMLSSIIAFIWYLAYHDPESVKKRPLPFPFWVFSLDFGKSPLYEICLLYSNICIAAYSFNYIFMMQIQILWIGQIAAKADLVIWSIEDLMEGIRPAVNREEKDYFSSLLKVRLQEIVRLHQSMIT